MSGQTRTASAIDGGKAIELCLVNNDPTSTTLFTTDGRPLYSIITSASTTSSTLFHGQLPRNRTMSCLTTPNVTELANRPPLRPLRSASMPETSSATPLVPASPSFAFAFLEDPFSRSSSHSSPNDSHILSTPSSSSSLCSPALKHALTTTIKRLDDIEASSGHVGTTVGVLQFAREEKWPGNGDLEDIKEGQVKQSWRPHSPAVGEGGCDGLMVDLCEQNFKLRLRPVDAALFPGIFREGRDNEASSSGLPDRWHDGSNFVNPGHGVTTSGSDVDTDLSAATSWTFVGPNKKTYRWQLLGRAPYLSQIPESPNSPDAPSVIPVARYKRAKIGITSRPRKSFLQIQHAGCDSQAMVDLVVATFVAFMRQRVIPFMQADAPEQVDVPAEGQTSRSIPSSLSRRESIDNGLMELTKKLEAACLSTSPPPMTSLDSPRPNPNTHRSSVPPTTHMLRRDPLTHEPVDSDSESGDTGRSASLSPRFKSAVALARKHSKSPPAMAVTFPPFAVKPRVREG